jgi:hypothetical protein
LGCRNEFVLVIVSQVAHQDFAVLGADDVRLEHGVYKGADIIVHGAEVEKGGKVELTKNHVKNLGMKEPAQV